MRAHDLYLRFDSLKSEKQAKITLMKDVNSFFIPEDTHWQGEQMVGLNNALQGELLDTTGTDLIEEYTSYVLGLQYNVQNRWFRIEHLDIDSLGDHSQALTRRADHLYKLIAKTNYYTQSPVEERDVLVHGHGIMVIEKDEDNFARCYTKDPTRIYFAQDEASEVRGMYWESYYTLIELLEKFPELGSNEATRALFNNNQDIRYQVISAYYPNVAPWADKKDLNKKNRKNKWVLQHILVDSPAGITTDRLTFKNADGKDYEMGLYTFTKKVYHKNKAIFPTRDEVTRHSPYGSGIGKKALPKARILNKLKADLLKVSGLQANPPRKQSADVTGAIAKGPLQEGMVLTTTDEEMDSSAGNKPIELLNVVGDLNATLAVYQNEQGQLAAMLPVAGNIYKNSRQSQSEIQQRTGEQEKRLGPLRAMYMREGVAQHVKRFYQLAEDAGEFNTEAMALPDGLKNIDFIFDANLLGGYRQSKAYKIAQVLGLISNYLTIHPQAADLLDVDKIVEIAFVGADAQDVLVTEEMVAKIREARQKQAEEQQAIAQQEASTRAASADGQLLGAAISAAGQGDE